MLRVSVLVVVMVMPAVAHADDVLSPPGLTPGVLRAAPAQRSPELPLDDTASYRGQILSADGVAVGLTLLGAMNAATDGRSTNTTSLVELGVATYLVAAPMIHLLHDRGTHAIASLGLRVALPVIGGLIGDKLHATCSDNYGNGYYQDCSGSNDAAVFGVGLGLIAASVLDAVFLADADEKPSTTRLTATSLYGAGVAVGLAGSF